MMVIQTRQTCRVQRFSSTLPCFHYLGFRYPVHTRLKRFEWGNTKNKKERRDCSLDFHAYYQQLFARHSERQTNYFFNFFNRKPTDTRGKKIDMKTFNALQLKTMLIFLFPNTEVAGKVDMHLNACRIFKVYTVQILLEQKHQKNLELLRNSNLAANGSLLSVRCPSFAFPSSLS